MNTTVVIGGVIAVAFVLGLGAWAMMRRQEEANAPPEPPSKRWDEDKITPVALGPRNTSRERVARQPVFTQTVLLACEMARADGHVADEEVDAIRTFIDDNMPEAEEDFADTILRDGLTEDPTADEVDAAIETIRAMGSEEQRRLAIQLLVAVAKADGKVTTEESDFMVKVGGKLGLTADAVSGLLQM